MPPLRVRAIMSLGMIGPVTADIIPELIESTADAGASQAHPSLAAMEALRRLGPATTPSLMKALEKGNPIIRERAAILLSGMGPEAKAAVPALTKLLKDSDRTVRLEAARALWKLDHQLKAALPVALEVLQSGDLFSRGAAIQMVVEIGSEVAGRRSGSHPVAQRSECRTSPSGRGSSRGGWPGRRSSRAGAARRAQRPG